MHLLGIDLGSSSVKVSVMNAENGQCLASTFYPKVEAEIISGQDGWAEQHPEIWYEQTCMALTDLEFDLSTIDAIGISYQMHGLVAVDRNGQVLRPAIIWCDDRAVEIGEKSFHELGEEYCLNNLLNSPGNFTATKLKWVQENEPELYARIHKIMLPGDYLAYRLSGEMNTTRSGLSEGVFWNFIEEAIDERLLKNLNINPAKIADLVPTFGLQAKVSQEASRETGIKKGIPITYRAGDQPNNAWSLNVLSPGEVAATAGTSGVVYGLTDQKSFDPKSRVNSFLHVNHQKDHPRIGVLMCINSTGILNSWLRQNVSNGLTYDEMNQLAMTVSEGSEGLLILPFGNGAERVLENKNIGVSIHHLNLLKHTQAHLIRAAHEGLAFSFAYGMEIMKTTGVETSLIRACKANMFLSPILRETLSTLTGATIELYDTDGALGAARGAGMGIGYYKSREAAFMSLKVLERITPNPTKETLYKEAYEEWKRILQLNIS